MMIDALDFNAKDEAFIEKVAEFLTENEPNNNEISTILNENYKDIIGQGENCDTTIAEISKKIINYKIDKYNEVKNKRENTEEFRGNLIERFKENPDLSDQFEELLADEFYGNRRFNTNNTKQDKYSEDKPLKLIGAVKKSGTTSGKAIFNNSYGHDKNIYKIQWDKILQDPKIVPNDIYEKMINSQKYILRSQYMSSIREQSIDLESNSVKELLMNGLIDIGDKGKPRNNISDVLGENISCTQSIR